MASKKKSLQIRIDEKLKRQVETVLASLGLDTPTAIRIFFMKIVADGGIPFELMQNEDYFSKEQLRQIDEAYQESLDPKNVIGPFDSVDAMLEHMKHQSP